MPDERIRTHWTDCWRDTSHHGCCVARVERLERELATAKGHAEQMVEMGESYRQQRNALAQELFECKEKLEHYKRVIQLHDSFQNDGFPDGILSVLDETVEQVERLKSELEDAKRWAAAWKASAKQIKSERDSARQAMHNALDAVNALIE